MGTVGYVFIRKDAIIENVKGKIMESIMPGGLGTGALEGLAGGGLSLPSPSNPMASPEATPTEPVLPLGF